MARWGWGALAVAAAVLPLATTNTYYLYLGASVAILVIVTAGLNVLAGFAGQISLGHAGFFAIGAYAAALSATRAGLPAGMAVVVAIALSALVGAAVAAAALRVSGPYLAMVTIAFGIIVEGTLVEWVPVTGGPGGIFNIPKPALARHYWVVAAAAAVALWMTANLRRSAWGRALYAVKGSDVAAESLGLSAYYVRIVAFTVSAAFTGAGGALFAFLNGYISPDSFTLQQSILFLLALLFGGLGHVAGPVAGSLVLTLLPELLTGLSDYRLILYGGLLLLSIYWLPSGVVGALAGRGGRGGSDERAGLSPPPDPLPGGEREPEGEERARVSHEDQERGPLLSAERVSLAFGGVAALDDVSLTIDAGRIAAVIGPNGAGKTSLLNVLSGYYAPEAGSITLAGRPIAGQPPFAIARLGVARTFQTAQLFGDLTVLGNAAVGLAAHRLGSLLGALVGTPAARRREREMQARARSLLGSMGLAAWADHPAPALPAGLRRRLEIARALATSPRVLMLDEPAAGLGPAEIAELDAQLSRLRDAGGPTVVLVEHHMDLVMAVSDRVTVLDYGRVIASGAPETVRRDPAVIEAYLGAATPPMSAEGAKRPTRHATSSTAGRDEPSAEGAKRPTRHATSSTASRDEPSAEGAPSTLSVSALSVRYGAAAVLHDVSLEIRQGEVVILVGANGAGKTTFLKTVAGVLRPAAGRITLDGRDIGGRPSSWVARQGVALVPEGRGIFGDQTVRDNLLLGALARREGRDAASVARDLDRSLALFPALAPRLAHPAGSLSGGQQQMLAVARGLMARPRFLLLDEPSLGLAPILVGEIFAAIERLRGEGVTILLVEQMAVQALGLADRAYVLERGRIAIEGPAAAVRENPRVVQAYLGRGERPGSARPEQTMLRSS